MHCVPILLLRTRTATSARDFSASMALHEEIQKETTTRHINMEEKRRARGREHCSGRRGAAMAEACDKRIIILAVFVRVICHFFAPCTGIIQNQPLERPRQPACFGEDSQLVP